MKSNKSMKTKLKAVAGRATNKERPSETRAAFRTMLRNVRHGLPVEEASIMAGVPLQTLMRWKRKTAPLWSRMRYLQLKRAQAEGKARPIHRVFLAARDTSDGDLTKLRKWADAEHAKLLHRGKGK